MDDLILAMDGVEARLKNAKVVLLTNNVPAGTYQYVRNSVLDDLNNALTTVAAVRTLARLGKWKEAEIKG